MVRFRVITRAIRFHTRQHCTRGETHGMVWPLITPDDLAASAIVLLGQMGQSKMIGVRLLLKGRPETTWYRFRTTIDCYPEHCFFSGGHLSR